MPDLPMPPRIAELRRTSTGKPIPYFVGTVDGRPDFRIMDGHRFTTAVRRKLCFICGQPLGQNMAFVIGPMCVVNRISAEPPSHRDCCEYAVRVCPFLTQPERARREAGLEDKGVWMAGDAQLHNPGVSALWVTRSYQVEEAAKGGVLFALGEPIEITWWQRAQPASFLEVLQAFRAGRIALEKTAESEGPESAANMATLIARAYSLLPRGP